MAIEWCEVMLLFASKMVLKCVWGEWYSGKLDFSTLVLTICFEIWWGVGLVFCLFFI